MSYAVEASRLAEALNGFPVSLLQVSFRARDGEKAGEKQVFDLAPHSSRRVELELAAEGFVGTSTVYCVGFSCLPVASWEFNFGEGRQFAVGVPGVSSLTNDNRWAALTTNPEGNFALAIMNFLAEDNPCTLDHYDLEGAMVASEEFVLPRFAQRAEVAEVAEGFTGRSELRCIGNVAVTSVVQDPVNGFPTAGFPMKQTFPPR